MRLRLLFATLFATSIASAATPVNGLYSSIFGGYTYIPGNINKYKWGILRSDSAYDGGYNAGIRFGYKSNPIRYEGEYTYLQASTNRFRVNHIRQTGVTGTISANLIMANIYYDTPDLLPSIAPFVGVGIGFALMQASLDSTGPCGNTFFSANDNSFAYQATIGLTYNFAENYSLNIAYRYAAAASSGNLGETFQANMASGGVIYRFDTSTYK